MAEKKKEKIDIEAMIDEIIASIVLELNRRSVIGTLWRTIDTDRRLELVNKWKYDAVQIVNRVLKIDGSK